VTSEPEVAPGQNQPRSTIEDGKLDYPNLLNEIVLTICSIHSKFALDKRAQTERFMRAMNNPYINILGHSTGRFLLRCEGYEIDFERLLKHASPVWMLL
jgi:DNA polymerase (family 10)